MSEIQTQIERRQQRALEEIVRVTNRGRHPLFSPFDVVSVSGRTYRVTIRSLDERRNSCTCPDYRTNLVGTCKHIEGVLLHLQQKYADDLKSLAAQKPTTAQIFLQYAEDITVRVSLPLPRAPELRALLTRYFDADGCLQGAALHLMEQESYRAFVTLAGATVERAAPEDEAYRAPALPAPADARAELEKRLQKVRAGFEFASKRAQLAEVVVRGGFPEEALRPLRDALGWALSSHRALVGDHDPSAEPPSARVIQAELVEPGYLADDLAARAARARELTEPVSPQPTGARADEVAAPPLSAKSAEALIAVVREIIEVGQKRAAEKGL